MSREAFLKELRTLLETYDVSIKSEVGEGSHMHKVYDQRITFYHREKPSDWEVWLSVDGCSVYPSDLFYKESVMKYYDDDGNELTPIRPVLNLYLFRESDTSDYTTISAIVVEETEHKARERLLKYTWAEYEPDEECEFSYAREAVLSPNEVNRVGILLQENCSSDVPRVINLAYHTG